MIRMGDLNPFFYQYYPCFNQHEPFPYNISHLINTRENRKCKSLDLWGLHDLHWEQKQRKTMQECYTVFISKTSFMQY